MTPEQEQYIAQLLAQKKIQDLETGIAGKARRGRKPQVPVLTPQEMSLNQLRDETERAQLEFKQVQAAMKQRGAERAEAAGSVLSPLKETAQAAKLRLQALQTELKSRAVRAEPEIAKQLNDIAALRIGKNLPSTSGGFNEQIEGLLSGVAGTSPTAGKLMAGESGEQLRGIAQQSIANQSLSPEMAGAIDQLTGKAKTVDMLRGQVPGATAEVEAKLANPQLQFLEKNRSAIDAAVADAYKSGGFPTDREGVTELFSKLGVDLKGSRPIFSGEGGKRVPGAKQLSEVMPVLNSMIESGVPQEVVQKQAEGLFGLVGAMHEGGPDFRQIIKEKMDGGGSMAAIGKGALAIAGVQMLADPLIERLVEQPKEQARVRRAADMTARDQVENYRLADALDGQAFSALSKFPAAAESLLGRMGAKSAPRAQSQAPQPVSGMFLPGGSPPPQYAPSEDTNVNLDQYFQGAQ